VEISIGAVFLRNKLMKSHLRFQKNCWVGWAQRQLVERAQSETWSLQLQYSWSFQTQVHGVTLATCILLQVWAGTERVQLVMDADDQTRLGHVAQGIGQINQIYLCV